MRLEPRPIPVCLALGLLLAVSGCGSEKKQPTKGTAAGEVLEGSVSDAMLPIDQVRSQAPLAPRSEGDDSKHGGRDSGTGDDAAKASDAPAEPAGGEGASGAAPAPATPSAE